jgi:hypothetical protein
MDISMDLKLIAETTRDLEADGTDIEKVPSVEVEVPNDLAPLMITVALGIGAPLSSVTLPVTTRLCAIN